MIRAKLEQNTCYLENDGKVHCVYCGNEILPDVEIDHGERTNYYHCQCENALKELKIKEEIKNHELAIKNLMSIFPKPKYKIVSTIKTELKEVQ